MILGENINIMSYEVKNYQGSSKWVIDAFTRSNGKKYLMAFTGFFLIIFLLVHLYGNLLLLKSDGGIAFNEYARSFLANLILRIIEIFLFMGLILHITLGIIVSIQNKKARGVGYASGFGVSSSFFSRYMTQTGGLIFIFLALHLKTFFYTHRIMETNLSMYESVRLVFENVYYTGFYIFVMILLSFHLMHGFQSAFQSFGLNHNKYSPLIKIFGKLYAVIVPGLFAFISFYLYYEKWTSP